LVRQSKFYAALLVIVSTLSISGYADNTGTPATKVESGTVNREYRGILKPVVPKKLKLTEQEKPPSPSGAAQQGSGGEKVAKPHV